MILEVFVKKQFLFENVLQAADVLLRLDELVVKSPFLAAAHAMEAPEPEWVYELYRGGCHPLLRLYLFCVVFHLQPESQRW